MKKNWEQLRNLIGRVKGNRRLLTINDAVNFEKEIIFISIPKTGTVTVRSQIQQEGTVLITSPHLNIMQVRDTLYVYFLERALEQNNSFPTKSVPADEDLRRHAKDVFDTFFKFSAVRNPWARAVSLFFRNNRLQLKRKISFEEFCDEHFYASDMCGRPTLHKNQLDWLCDENGRLIMDYVYKVENFAMAIKEINEQTEGRLQLTYKVENKNPKSLAHRYRELYSDRTRKIIGERFQKDIDHFKYTF